MYRLLFLLFLLPLQAAAQANWLDSLGLSRLPLQNCTAVKNQFLSSTCWSFASLSLLESECMRNGHGTENLSEMFVARHSMVRKIERHLAVKGSNFFTPGGQFHDVIWVLKNKGLVPEAIYDGKARGEFQHNHAAMDTVLSHFVNECVAKGITQLDKPMRAWTDSVLDYYYGKLPETFTWKGKKYTPQSYLTDYLRIQPDDYLEITSYTHHPFYTQFVLEDKYNWTGDAYWNVPAADFRMITEQALENGYTVGWDGDADDPGFDYGNGLAWLAHPAGELQEARQKAFESQATLLNHVMHIVAMVRRQGHTWYYIKNSWGYDSNPLGGFLYMNDDYFLMRTVAIIVHRNAIPEAILHKMGLTSARHK